MALGRRSTGTVHETGDSGSTGGRRAVTEAASPRPWWVKTLRWIGEFLIYLVVALLVVTLLRIFLVEPFLVPTGSMENTLMGQETTADGSRTRGDTILAWKPGAPQRGEIVVFRDDLNWLAPLTGQPPAWKQALAWVRILPPQDEQFLVKRLIGLPGDHVTCCDVAGRITVNGQPLDESSYLYTDSQGNQAAPSTYHFDLVVPAGHIFVMGDHRNDSLDSRGWLCGGTYNSVSSSPTPELAFPSIDSIQGQAVAILAPFSRLRTFSIPDTFSTVPEPSSPAPPTPTVSWTCPLQ